MKHRKLRIAWSVAWGLAVVLLAVLWARSYSNTDIAYGPVPFGRVLEFESSWGSIKANLGRPYGGPVRYRLRSESLSANDKDATEHMANAVYPYGFAWVVLKGGSYIIIPHWFAMSLATLIAGYPWVPPLRFSLRTLLIATTLVAVGLGLIVWVQQHGRIME